MNEQGLEQEEDGFFYEEISYQRKGVKKGLYRRYNADCFLMESKEIKELKKFIDLEHRQTFGSEFEQKFNEGEHLILISY